MGFAEAEMRDGNIVPSAPTRGAAPAPSAGRPAGAPLASPVAEVTKVLQEMSTQQIYDIMVQMKGLIQQNPDQARQILTSNPQVAYALLQAQITLGFITPAVAQQILVSTAAATAPMVAAPPQAAALPTPATIPPPLATQGGMPSQMPYGAPAVPAPSGFGPAPGLPYSAAPMAPQPVPPAAASIF